MPLPSLLLLFCECYTPVWIFDIMHVRGLYKIIDDLLFEMFKRQKEYFLKYNIQFNCTHVFIYETIRNFARSESIAKPTKTVRNPWSLWEHDKIERRQKNISLYITTIPSEYKNIQSINEYYTLQNIRDYNKLHSSGK